MTVRELNRDQLIELKQAYLTQKLDEQGEGISYGELAEADELVSDAEIFEEYAGTDFVPDDFTCSAGQESEQCWCFKLLDNCAYGSREDIARILSVMAEDIRNGGVRGRVHAVDWKIERCDW